MCTPYLCLGDECMLHHAADDQQCRTAALLCWLNLHAQL